MLNTFSELESEIACAAPKAEKTQYSKKILSLNAELESRLFFIKSSNSSLMSLVEHFLILHFIIGRNITLTTFKDMVKVKMENLQHSSTDS